MAARTVINFTVQTGILQPIARSMASVDSGDAKQTGRLNRFSPASSCGTVKANPGLFATTGARAFDSYSFTNDGPDACVTVTLNNPNGSTAFAVAYAGSFNPATPAINYLADVGNSASYWQYVVQYGGGPDRLSSWFTKSIPASACRAIR